ncbi:hypothetical protein K523DRAFT_367293, partial [Schizophyllum commune Tattone D]
ISWRTRCTRRRGLSLGLERPIGSLPKLPEGYTCLALDLRSCQRGVCGFRRRRRQHERRPQGHHGLRVHDRRWRGQLELTLTNNRVALDCRVRVRGSDRGFERRPLAPLAHRADLRAGLHDHRGCDATALGQPGGHCAYPRPSVSRAYEAYGCAPALHSLCGR